MKQWARVTAVVGLSALALAACGEAPDEAGGTTDEGAAPAAAGEATTGRRRRRAGGLHRLHGHRRRWRRRPLLQRGGRPRPHARRSRASASRRTSSSPTPRPTTPRTSSSSSPADCDLIIGVGFLLAGAVGEAAAANPEESFALIDSSLDEPADNVKPLLFNTAEAAFLGGYLAAGMTETGTVATFGGIPIPPVTIFMDGFVDGVAYYNEQKGTDV